MGKERGETMWKRRVVIVDYDTSLQWTSSRIPINCTCSSGIPRRAGQRGSHVSIYQNHSFGWLSKERERKREINLVHVIVGVLLIFVLVIIVIVFAFRHFLSQILKSFLDNC